MGSILLNFAIYGLIIAGFSLMIFGGLIKFIQGTSKTLNMRGRKMRVAFMHPNCNAAAGGEKVLWCMIKAIISQPGFSPKSNEIVIYSGENVPLEPIIAKVKDRFLLEIDPSSIRVIRLSSAWLVNPFSFPFATIFFQVLGTIIFTLHCLWKYPPHVFIDTTGLAFSFLVVKLIVVNVKTCAYVHYPFISKEMIDAVRNSVGRYNNSGRISKSKILTRVKFVYYYIFYMAYKYMGSFVDTAYCNSSWTFNHMKELWNPNILSILYPPCNVNGFKFEDLSKKEMFLVSFAQFRIEKRHDMQLEIFKAIREKTSDPQIKDQLRFKIIGSVRGPEDESILRGLQDKVKEMKLENSVEFCVNLPFQKIKETFKTASFGIHTMESEHFGISIVEMMAAGMVVLAHDSAGPALDIIKKRQSDPVGYLCTDASSFAEKLLDIIGKQSSEKGKEELDQLRTRAKDEMIARFSDESFIATYGNLWKELVGKKSSNRKE